MGKNAKSVAVIGGGISGMGIAEAVQAKGYQVTLFEKGAFGKATSDASLRIIHGGFRYLQQLNMKRVLESLNEQQDLLNLYPEHIEKLPCLMPLNRLGLKSRYPAQVAIYLYGMLMRLNGYPRPDSTVLKSDEIKEQVPLLADLESSDLLKWQDAQVPDHDGFCKILLAELEVKGVSLRKHTEVKEIAREQDVFKLNYYDKERGEEEALFDYVINATGPWLERIKLNFDLKRIFKPYGWCKGFNFILTRKLEEYYGIGREGEERRLFFTTPRGGVSVIGTWYIPFSENPDLVTVTIEEQQAALNGYNSCFPALKPALSIDDISHIEVGVLPMKAESNRGPVLYGSERVYNYGGYIEVLSTKYTTFKALGRKVVSLLE